MLMQPSVSQTLSRFWNGKRFIVLAIFALLSGNIVAYVVGAAAEKQVKDAALGAHGKIFSVFNEVIEQEKKATPATPESMSTVSQNDALNPDFEPSLTASFWSALKETRRQYSNFKTGLITEASADNEREKKILSILKNKPKAWKFSELEDGWLRSYFVLPTKTVSAFEVISYVRDDLQTWKSTALWLGFFAGFIFLAFGWFWSRALDQKHHFASYENLPTDEKISNIAGVVQEIASLITQMETDLELTEKSVFILTKDKANQISEGLSEIKMLILNGTIEAGRNAAMAKTFLPIFQELGKSIEKARQQLKESNQEDSAPLIRLKSTLSKANQFTSSASEEPKIFSSKRA